jgi:hypothetical protein
MFTRSLFFELVLATSILAQSIIPSNQPACAQTCPVLVQAQQACAPDVGNSAQYQSCFCQSAYLTSIKSNPQNNICAPQCSASDFSSIASWFNGVCNAAPGQTTLVIITSTLSSATQGQATATTSSSATASSTLPPPGSDAATNPSDYTDGPSW